MAIHTTTLTQRIAHSVFSWEWTKKLLYWIVMSAGTMSECAFLIASIYMSLNASVHSLVLVLVSEQTSVHIAELATAAYVALPECILCLAIVTVIGHARVWLYNRDKAALIWTVLYGIPTAIFLVLSLVTLGCAVASADFRLPEGFIIVRALAGYMFALTSLLHMQLGVPQERERLAEKDRMLAQVQAENARMIDQIQQHYSSLIKQLRDESEKMIAELQQSIRLASAEHDTDKNEIARLQQEMTSIRNDEQKSRNAALEGYSQECVSWLDSGLKTANIDDVCTMTGHAKQKITWAVKKGHLQVTSRNKDLILMASLIEWLKVTPPSTSDEERDTTPLLHVVHN